MDFTQKKYAQLLEVFQAGNYHFMTFEDYCMQKKELAGDDRFLILRHDVDLKAENSLEVARIESALGIRSVYYFRYVKQSNKPEIIKDIISLGHEIGYHYEDLTACDGDMEKAIVHFEHWLNYLRQYYPVKTICMHGSPRSKYDSKEMWKNHDYHSFGIIGEPYFDVDFSKVFYLTDTGRRWDGFSVSIRDRIPVFQDSWNAEGLVYHKTDDIIDAVEKDRFPKQAMITTHPQRWTNNMVSWANELLLQNAKNQVKKRIKRV